jgi:hypothetical protein
MSEPMRLPPEVTQWLEATMQAQSLQSQDITRMADGIGRMAEAFQRIALALERERGIGPGGPGGPGGEPRRQEWSGWP